jgi:hypothetical protein
MHKMWHKRTQKHFIAFFMVWHMNSCNYKVYICLSANINQLEIKLQKRKAEKD